MEKLNMLLECWLLVLYKTLILIVGIFLLTLLTILFPFSKTKPFDEITNKWCGGLKYDEFFNEW
jgi:hypothetical protein